MKKEYILGIDIGKKNAYCTSSFKCFGDIIKYEIDKRNPDQRSIEKMIEQCTPFIRTHLKKADTTIVALENYLLEKIKAVRTKPLQEHLYEVFNFVNNFEVQLKNSIEQFLKKERNCISQLIQMKR